MESSESKHLMKKYGQVFQCKKLDLLLIHFMFPHPFLQTRGDPFRAELRPRVWRSAHPAKGQHAARRKIIPNFFFEGGGQGRESSQQDPAGRGECSPLLSPELEACSKSGLPLREGRSIGMDLGPDDEEGVTLRERKSEPRERAWQ